MLIAMTCTNNMEDGAKGITAFAIPGDLEGTNEIMRVITARRLLTDNGTEDIL